MYAHVCAGQRATSCITSQDHLLQCGCLVFWDWVFSRGSGTHWFTYIGSHSYLRMFCPTSPALGFQMRATTSDFLGSKDWTLAQTLPPQPPKLALMGFPFVAGGVRVRGQMKRKRISEGLLSQHAGSSWSESQKTAISLLSQQVSGSLKGSLLLQSPWTWAVTYPQSSISAPCMVLSSVPHALLLLRSGYK